MQYASIKPFKPVTSIIIPPKGIKGKNVCLAVFPENDLFFDFYRLMGIKPAFVKHVHVPIVQKPVRIRLTPTYKKIIKSHKLFPSQGHFGDYTKVSDKNFYLDMSMYIAALQAKFKITRYNSGRAYVSIQKLISALDSVPAESHERVILYAVNIDKPIPKKLLSRRIYPVWAMLFQYISGRTESLPFDKLLLFIYGQDEKRFVLLYDKDKKVNLARIKSYLKKLKSLDKDDEEAVESEITSQKTVENLNSTTTLTNVEKDNVQKTVDEYLEVDPSAKEEPIGNIVAAAIAYKVTGSIEKAKSISKKATSTDKEKIIQNYAKDLIPKQKAYPQIRSAMVKMASPADIIDNQVPTHLLEKRKRDFAENLVEDLTDAFKVLENKDMPLKVKDIEVKTMKSPPSDLTPTIKDRYTVTMTDDKGVDQTVYMDLPHLTENGTFMIYGQENVLINQIIPYPIFFLKPYLGRFESSYSTVAIYSKRLKRTSYLMIHIGNYKIPLTMFMAYKYGLKQCLNLFGMKYTLTDKKDGENSLKLHDGTFINFTFEDDILGPEVIESFRFALPSIPEGEDIESSETWQHGLESYTDNRNCVDTMDQIWANIVTPIEIKILKSKGDPTNIRDIIIFIAKEVVRGRVDDRNGCDKLRIRSSELFVALAQKQVLMAYNEYMSKRAGGDTTATLYINPTSVFTDVITSQNVAILENINPVEELSTMTRISPVGIGGVPKSEAFPRQAMNVHPTYFGCIDPLDTPNGPGVGFQQHLTVGATISNVRGQMIVKDRKNVKATEILSVSPALIPFVESNEGARVTMAAGQQKQAVPIKFPENPAVQTGYEACLTPLLSDSFIKKSPVDGEIVDIKDGFILVLDKSGKTHVVGTRPANLKSGGGQDGLSVFHPTVKLKQKVKEGTIIAEGANVKDGLISNGVNMLTGMMPWKGYNFEDGMVISESAAAKFISVHAEHNEALVTPEEDISFIQSIGNTIRKGDILLTYSTAIYDVQANKHIRAENGRVTDIEVYSNVPEDAIPEKLLPAYERFRDQYKTLHGKYPIGHFREKGEKFEGIKVKFIIAQELSIFKGDKLNNRHFNKGVVAIIEKDENMPETPWGDKLEMLYNPLSILNRMITGQLLEMATGLVAKRIADLMEELPRKRFEVIYHKILVLMDGTKGKTYSKRVHQKMSALSDPAYETIRKQVIKNGFVPIICAPFKSPDRKAIEVALKLVGRSARTKLKIAHLGVTTEPVAVGYVYVNKLEHMSEKKIHSRGTGGYNSITFQPTAGKRKGGGQKLGEYDMYSLLGWNCPTLIDEFFGPLSADHATKNQMVSEIHQTGSTEFKTPVHNPVKDLFSQMMTAIHLESE